MARVLSPFFGLVYAHLNSKQRVGRTHSSGNEVSRPIAETLGFTLEGIRRRRTCFLVVNGQTGIVMPVSDRWFTSVRSELGRVLSRR
jgi:RimJ/RimL family protein N-acetyltransferase